MSFLSCLAERAGLIKTCLVLLVSVYVALLLYKPGLSPSDEYAFLPTLQSGKLFPRYGEDFPYYNSTQIGRFGPLGGQEYNLVAPITRDPLGYFVFNAVELVLLTVFLIVVLNAVSNNRGLNYLTTAFLLTVPAVTNTYFKLLYVEKNVALLLALFLAAHIAFQRHTRWGYFAAALVAANLAIYYKEPVFIAIGVFCAGHLFFTWRTAAWRARSLDLAGIASAGVWVLIYVTTVLPQQLHAIPSGYGVDNVYVVFTKTVFNYGFMTDPVPVLIVLPLAIMRLYQIFFRKVQAHPIVDPLLGAASAYITVFFVLNLYSPYYLLPAYVLALPALCHFIDRSMLTTRVWKFLFVTVGAAVLLNALPTGLHYLTYNKYLPINFSDMTAALIREVEQRYRGERVRIFFDGVDRGNGRGVYFIAGEFLRYHGLPIQKFDFASNVEARDPGPFVGRRSPFDTDEDIRKVDPHGKLAVRDFPFTVFQPGPLPEIKRGDILVISPQSTKWTDREYVTELNKDYEFVFATTSTFAVPSVTIKTLIKYAMMRRDQQRGESSGLMVSQNLFNWPDYYVLVKR